MSTVQDLSAAHEQFGRVLSTTDASQMDVPTPCEGWTVGHLIGHVLGGERMTVALLDGATADDARGLMRGVTVMDAPAQYASIVAEVEAAFGQPGVLERTVHHPMGDVSAQQLLGFRVGDLTVHSWDLSRAIAGDEVLDPGLVEAVWTDFEPLAPMMGAIGVFGEGPSGDLGDDAALQLRLLDLTGRRP